MTQIRLVMKIRPNPATWEGRSIERDSLELGNQRVMSQPRRLLTRNRPRAQESPESVPFDLESPVAARRNGTGSRQHWLGKGRRRSHRPDEPNSRAQQFQQLQ